MPGNVKNPQTGGIPFCLCFSSQTTCERTQPCGYASSTGDQGTAHCCAFCHSNPQQAFDFRLPSFFESVFHSSKAAWLEESIPTLTLVWRLHLYLGFWFTATHHHFKVKTNHSRNAQAWCPPLYSLWNTGFQVSRKKSTLGKKSRDVSKSQPFISVFT